MKKRHILFLCISASTYLAAQTTDSKPTFVITNFEAPTADEGLVHTEAKYDAGIEIRLRNVTQKKWKGTLFPNCLEKPLYDTQYVEVVNKNTIDPESEDHSFIEIRSTGKADIERVEFVAGAAGRDARLTCAPSIDGNDYLNDYVLQGTKTTVRKPITFAASSGNEMQLCGITYFYDVPKSIEYNSMWGGSGPAYTEFRKMAKYIRLNWGNKQFAGTINTKGDPVNLFAVKIYTNANTTITGIENEEQDKFGATLIGNRLVLSQSATVQIYSAQGKLVFNLRNVGEADLSNLSKGMYIIKAQAINKKQTVVRKIII